MSGRRALMALCLILPTTLAWAEEEKKDDNFLIIAGKDKLTLTSGLTMVSQRSSGVDENPSALSYSLDLVLDGQMGTHGYIYVALNTAQGESLPTALTGGTNFDDESEHFSNTQISEARYDVCLNDQSYLTIGKIDSSAIYDKNAVANDETTQFLAGTLVNNVSIPFPTYALGINATYMPTKTIDLNLGVFEPGTEVDGTLNEQIIMGEVAWKTRIGAGDTNLRLTFWDCNACLVDVNRVKNHGLGFNFDHALTEEVTVFGRYGNMNDAMAGFDSAYSLGGDWQYTDKLRAGLGYAMHTASEDQGDDESIAEFYVSYAWARNVTFTVDLQFVSNPGFDSETGDFTAMGLRSQVDF